MQTTQDLSSYVNLSELAQDDESMMEFYLVTTDEADKELSPILQIAHKALHEHVPVKRNIILIRESKCLELTKEDVTADTVFIVEKFEGNVFRHLENFKEIYVLGVKALLAVLYKKINVPALMYHFYDLSMKNVFICFSSVEKPEKKKLAQLAAYMGGAHSNGLKEITTHLVTEDIYSPKYMHANERHMKVMRPEWLREAWKMNQDFNFQFDINDPYFDRFKLPIFHGLVASSTGIELELKKKLISVIEANGGEFSNIFKTSSTNMLLMEEKDINSPKATASFKFNIRCVDPKWIFDSVDAGYALPLEKEYVIGPPGSLKASTPKKDTTAMSKFDFNGTMLSEITQANSTAARSLMFEETQRSSKSISTSPRSSIPSKRSSRLSEKNDTFKKPQPVRSTVSVATTRPSIQSIRSTFIEEKENVNDENENSAVDDRNESYIEFLSGKSVFIYGYAEENYFMQTLSECEKLGAHVVDSSYSKVVDYIITPSTVIAADEPKMKYKCLVTDSWLMESSDEKKCLDIKFYHSPIFNSSVCEVLKDEVFVLSLYDPVRERPYIKRLITILGGKSREILNKTEYSIVLCPTPQGKKYDGAISWDFPVLRAEWLYACYSNKMRYDETQFLVGSSIPSTRNKKNQRASIIPYSQGTPPLDSEIMDIDGFIQNEDVLPKRVVQLRGFNCESPKTPGRDQAEEDMLSISNLVADMPTPQREITKAALLEDQANNSISPRAQRQRELLKTPGNTQQYAVEESSPMPELPDLMHTPPVDHSIRPDSSPNSQWFWKMKMDALDEQYSPKSESTKKGLREGLDITPYANKRYIFYKKRVPNYDSPDPNAAAVSNGESAQPIALDEDQNLVQSVEVNMVDEASNFLNFDESEAPAGPHKNTDEQLRLIDSGRKRNNDSDSTDASVKESDFRKQLDLRDIVLADKKVIWASSTQIMQEGQNRAAVAHVDPTEIIPEMSVDEETMDEDVEEDSSIHWKFGVTSSGSNEDKLKIASDIEKLGGTIVEDDFNYLIMHKATKSCKYFCALARGKFVLHPDYVKDSMLAKKFLIPDMYEYGNPLFKCNVSDNKVAVDIIKGPYKCRMTMEANSERFRNGLFTGMKFLVVSSDKRDVFCQVIESGGGIVVDEHPEYKSAILKRQKVDYCLVEQQSMIKSRDAATLKDCNIPIKTVKFIYEYLLSEIH